MYYVSDPKRLEQRVLQKCNGIPKKSSLLFLKDETRTMVFYESPHRIIKTLENFKETFGEDRRCSVSREISKMFEETVRGTLSEILAIFVAKPPKGEIVIVLEGNKI